MAISVDGVPVSGSTGNKTYSRNRYGAYIRRRTKPVNPDSPDQVTARARFNIAVEAWYGGLSSIQRTAWENWAAATPWLNRAGETTHLTGQAAWIRYACASMAGSMTFIPPIAIAPPVTNNVGAIACFNPAVVYDPTPGTETLTLTFEAPALGNTGGAATGLWIVRLSPGMGPGRRYHGSQFTGPKAGTWTAGVVTAQYNAAELAALRYLPSIGQQVWLKVRSVGPVATDPRVSEAIVIGPAIVADGS